MIYLASPYNHPNPAVMAERYERALATTARIMSMGLGFCYSPIVHNHPLAHNFSLPRTWEFWREMDVPILRVCHKLFVLTIEGWRESVGVNDEIAIAQSLYIPIFTIDEWGRLDPWKS